MGNVCDSGLSRSGALQGTLRACRTPEPGHSDTGSLSGGLPAQAPVTSNSCSSATKVEYVQH